MIYKLFLLLFFIVVFSSCSNRPESSSIDKDVKVVSDSNYLGYDSLIKKDAKFVYDSNYFGYDSLGMSFLLNNDGEGRKNYKSILDSFSKNYFYSGTLNIDDLEIIMPKTRNEYAIYYKAYWDEEKQKQKFLHYADSLILEYGYRDSQNCFYILFNMFDMKDFIYDDDRYHLEVFYKDSYFEDLLYAVDFATEDNQMKFKKLYYSFDNERQKKYEWLLLE